MKLIVPALFILTLSLPLSSAEKKPVAPKEQYGAVVVSDNVLTKLLAVSGVDPVYKDCQKRYSNLEEIPDCIWKGLSDNQKKQVKELYAQEESAEKRKERSPASETPIKIAEAFKTGLTDKKSKVAIDYSTDPAVKALIEFYGKKFSEILDSDPKEKGKLKTIDHSKFIELYTNELGKTIINSFTSYCMEVDPECRRPEGSLCLSSDDKATRDDYIKQNLKAVNKAKFDDSEGNPWLKCITDVSKVCDLNPADDDDKKYSNKKACLIMDFVGSARKSLLAAKEQTTFYDSLKNKGIGIASNMEVVDDKKEATADKLTELTSADIDKDFKGKDNKKISIAKANEQTLKEAQECSKDGVKITDEIKCKKFLDTKADENAGALTDLGLRKIIKSEELDEKLKDDKNVESYLAEEGYTKDQIKDMMSKDNMEELKDRIRNRFKNEKNAVIQEMADKIKKKSTDKDGKISDTDTTKIGRIKAELSTRNEDLKNLIHFNNVVSGYLTIENKSNNQVSRNTASLIAEVNSMKNDEGKELQENIKSNKNMTGEKNSASLEIKDLNTFFMKYMDFDKKKPNEK
jgi:hypothetical protein